MAVKINSGFEALLAKPQESLCLVDSHPLAALFGYLPFRPLIRSHSAEVFSKFGNSIMRAASCFGDLGKRLVSGPFAMSGEI